MFQSLAIWEADMENKSSVFLLKMETSPNIILFLGAIKDLVIWKYCLSSSWLSGHCTCNSLAKQQCCVVLPEFKALIIWCLSFLLLKSPWWYPFIRDTLHLWLSHLFPAHFCCLSTYCPRTGVTGACGHCIIQTHEIKWLYTEVVGT